MTVTTAESAATVRRSVTVKTSVDRAFHVFTAEFDSWWPRSHHIGKSPMTRAIIEQKAGGRCYSQQADGSDCDWGQVLAWEPPHRFVIAWQITPQWAYEPDLSKSSEVEIRFTPEGKGTRVDLEHRHFERHGDGAAAMRAGVDSPNGWGDLLAIFTAYVEKTSV